MKIQRPIFLQVEHALSRAGIASYPAWLNVPRWARSPHREEPDSAGGGLSSEGLVVAAACSGHPKLVEYVPDLFANHFAHCDGVHIAGKQLNRRWLLPFASLIGALPASA
jgi:hypothetical protein